jgi:two-component sensor histidine kinase
MEAWLKHFQFWRPENARGNAVAGCVAAIVLVAFMLLLRYLIAFAVPEPPRLIIFTPVILIATLVGGASSGFFALALSLLVGGGMMWFEAAMPPQPLLVTVGIFAVVGGFIVWIAAHYRSLVRELRELEDRRGLLHRELVHRSRNLQMVIHSIVRYTLAEDRAKAEEINGRIASLAAASHLLNQSDDQTADLAAILRTEMQAFGADRVHIDGPSLQLPSMHAKVVALVFHELATNAAKHGSLSVAAGRVRISWSMADDLVEMQWLEMHGPAVASPNSTGFGTMFVQRMLEGVEGTITTDYGSEGLRCHIDFKLPRGRPADEPAYRTEFQPVPAPQR